MKKSYRPLTNYEKEQGKILVHKVWAAQEMDEAKRKLEQLRSERDCHKEELAEQRHDELKQGIDDVKELIMNPLKGLDVDQHGTYCLLRGGDGVDLGKINPLLMYIYAYT